MSKSDFEVIFILVLLFIMFKAHALIEKYKLNKRKKLEKKALVLYKYNQDFRKLFDNFYIKQCEDSKSFSNYNDEDKEDLRGIIDNTISIYGISTYVFYKHKADEFKEQVFKKIREASLYEIV